MKCNQIIGLRGRGEFISVKILSVMKDLIM